MPTNTSKKVTALFVTTTVAVTCCTHSMWAPLGDSSSTEKTKRVGEPSPAASDLSGRMRRALPPGADIRARQSGSTLESEIPELAALLADVAKHPKDHARRLKLAMIYHQSGLYEEASTQYHNVLNHDPKNAQAYERLGKLWLDWGASDRALGAVEKAIALRPDFVEAYNTLGLVYDARGDFMRSQTAYRRALEINPNLDYVYNNLCYSYTRSRNYRQAAAACREALRLNPQNPVAYNNLGYALGMLEDFAGAYQAFASSGDPAAAHNNLGVVLQAKQRYREAQAQFKKAWDLKPDYRLAAENYAALAKFVPAAPESLAATKSPAVDSSRPLPAVNAPRADQPKAAPSASIPTLADPVAVSRQAEEKLLDTLAETLRLRVLSTHAASFSFNPDFMRLSAPVQGASAPLAPARINPVLPAGALELRPAAPLSGDERPADRDPLPASADGALAPRPAPDATRPLEFVRLDILPPKPITVTAPLTARSNSPALAATVELRPVASTPITPPRLISEAPASTQALLSPSQGSALSTPVRVQPVLPAHAMELRPAHSLPASIPPSGLQAPETSHAALAHPETPAAHFARWRAPEWRPVTPLASDAPPTFAEAHKTGDAAALLPGRVPEFPAQLIIQTVERAPSVAEEASLTFDTALSVSAASGLEHYRFELGRGGHLEMPLSTERVLAKYSMSGPLELSSLVLGRAETTYLPAPSNVARPALKSAVRTRPAQAVRRAQTAPITDGMVNPALTGLAAPSALISEVAVTDGLVASVRGPAVDAGVSNVLPTPLRSTPWTGRWASWAMILALLLLSTGELLRRFHIRWALNRKLTLLIERLRMRP